MISLHKPVFAKPKHGLKIRKEDGTYLPDEGDTVIHSSYWARRKNDDDVDLSEVPDVEDKTEEPSESTGKRNSTK